MLKFGNVEWLDGRLNKQLLNQYRNETCSVEDVKQTFKIINYYRQRNDYSWHDYYNYLKLTTRRLRKLGCNVSKLERAFNKQEKGMIIDCHE